MAADPEPLDADRADQTRSTKSSNTLLNALIGAVVTAVTTPLVPFAPILGGAVAGYLDADGADNGVKVGAISGAIALVPLLIIAPFVLLFLFLDPIVAVSVFAIATVVMAFLAMYTVGFSALGGFIGVYLREELRQS